MAWGRRSRFWGSGLKVWGLGIFLEPRSGKPKLSLVAGSSGVLLQIPRPSIKRLL